MIGDVAQGESDCTDFEGIVSIMERLPVQTFQERIFEGILHHRASVAQMLAGRRDLFHTIAALPQAKRQWLAFVELYPFRKTSPMVQALEFLLRSPEEFRKTVLFLLKIFWKSGFEMTWKQLQQQLRKSVEEKNRLFHSCTLKEFARMALLRVEIDESGETLKAVRGGFRMSLKKVRQFYFFPSCFNDKRLWTSYGEPPVVCFPYFDPAISMEFPGRATIPAEVSRPELDPAFIFNALGDSTRYAIVSLLARSALKSADLSRALSLSPPTVSHHIHVLREAGLLEEQSEGNSVRLSLKREVLEELSELAVRNLFHSSEEIQLKKTRKK